MKLTNKLTTIKQILRLQWSVTSSSIIFDREKYSLCATETGRNRILGNCPPDQKVG